MKTMNSNAKLTYQGNSTIFSARFVKEGQSVLVRTSDKHDLFFNTAYLEAIASAQNTTLAELVVIGKPLQWDTYKTPKNSEYCDEDGTVIGKLTNDKIEHQPFFACDLMTQVAEKEEI